MSTTTNLIVFSWASRTHLINRKKEHPKLTLDGDMECQWSAISLVQTPDIISVQETWLRTIHTLALANYKVYRYDRNHTPRTAYAIPHGGGTAILRKNSLKHTHIPMSDLNDAEATMVALIPERGDSTLIVSMYIRPGFKTDESVRKLSTNILRRLWGL
ncbi:hypothetical protein TNCV_4048841 [Trichonephila clavipes]|nr:hypothetical protein TNCV_4048841 [Trichonephila clavipes]